MASVCPWCLKRQTWANECIPPCGSTDSLALSQCSPNPSSVACFPVQSSEFPALLASTLPQLSLQLPTQSTLPVVFLFVSFHLSCPYCWLKSVSDHCTPCFHTSFPLLILPNCQSEGTSFPCSKTSMQALPASRRKFPVSKAPQAPSNRPCCSPSTPHPTSLPLYRSPKWRWVQFSFVCLFFNILCSFTSSGSFAWSVNGLFSFFLCFLEPDMLWPLLYVQGTWRSQWLKQQKHAVLSVCFPTLP